MSAAAVKHILVIDDEARIRDVVEYALKKEGFAVTTAGDAEDGLAKHARGGVDAVVLDVMLPGADGLEVCRRIRAGNTGGARTPILFLSARGEEIDRVVGLELGGDDYLVKPFSPRELVARVRALLRRAEPPVAMPPEVGTPQVSTHLGVTVDLARWEVRVRGVAVELTRTEFGVLAALFERPGIVLSRSQLMQRAYPYDNLVTDRTIDTHIRRIRAKFRPHRIDPIATVHGVGYKAGEERGKEDRAQEEPAGDE